MCMPNLTYRSITADQLVERMGGALPAGFFDDGLGALHPAQPNCFEFWGPASELRPSDYHAGDRVRLRVRTAGRDAQRM